MSKWNNIDGMLKKLLVEIPVCKPWGEPYSLPPMLEIRPSMENQLNRAHEYRIVVVKEVR